jgi:7,8-dihydropterin-6-yl-methyl-4-(beta-D-ribofuranosyl)aminobenzene 5'-phosphate synthase
MRRRPELKIRIFLSTLLYLCACHSAGIPTTLSEPPPVTGKEAAKEAADASGDQPAATWTAQMTRDHEQDQAPEHTDREPANSLKITIVYDNNGYDPRLKTAWGFAAHIEIGGSALLFDTGGDGSILLRNMDILGIDPTEVDAIVLSHIHQDHVGGLENLLQTGGKPVIYLLPSFPEQRKAIARQRTEVVEVTPGMSFANSVYTTGEIEGPIPEQALVVKQEEGLVILTGCAHPGVVQIIRRAKDLFDEPVYLVMGGFHLGDRSAQELAAIVAEFRNLGVERVAPCHCTGDRAIAVFRQEYQEDFIEAGAGRVIQADR